MRSIVLALLVTVSGCFSLGATASVVGPSLDGAPVRPVNGTVELGTVLGTKRVVLNPAMLIGLGPLGESDSIGEAGVRAYYVPDKWPLSPLSPYGRVMYGQAIFSIAAGLALASVNTDNALIPGMATGFGALNLGIVYRQQRQDGIGDGQFLGLELGFTFGVDLLSFMLKGGRACEFDC